MKRIIIFSISTVLVSAALAQPVGPGFPFPNPKPSLVPPPPIPGNLIANSKTDQLHLMRGNGMLGQFLGYDAQKGLTWSHPDIKPDVLSIPADRVSRIDFALKPTPETSKPYGGEIVFTNGDRLTGDLLGMDDNKLRINTWYAGELAVDRNTIRSLVPGITSDAAIYAGPTTKNGWKEVKSGSLGWKLVDGGFESATSGPVIGRAFPKMPANARVEFDLDWKRGTPSLYIGFLSDNLTSYSGGNCYSIRFSGSSIYMYRYAKINGGIQSKRLQTDTSSSKSYNFGSGPKKKRIALCHDPKKKTVAVIIDGKLVGVWNDTSPNAPALSNGINFSSRTSNPMRISRLSITPWNGNLPGPNSVAAAAGAKEDFIAFANGDVMTGSLKSTDKEDMKFESAAFGKVDISLAKVNTIHFARDSLLTPPTPANSIRATLTSNSRITGIIKAWKGNHVTLTSPIFGEATFDASIFRKVEFNLGKPRSASLAPNSTPIIRSRLRLGNREIPELELNGAFQMNGREIPPEIVERLQLLQKNQLRAVPQKRR